MRWACHVYCMGWDKKCFWGGGDSWLLKMGPKDCSKTSLSNYHYSLRNSTEERSSHLLRGGSPKSRKVDSKFDYKKPEVKGVLTRPRHRGRIMFNKWGVRMRSGFIWPSRLCVVCIYSLHKRLFIPEAGLLPKLMVHTESARGEIFVCSPKTPIQVLGSTQQCGQGVRLTTHPHLVQGPTMGSRSMPTQWRVSNNTAVSDMHGAHASNPTQTQITRNRPINATQMNVQLHPTRNPTLKWGGWPAARCGRFNPVKDTVPVVQEASALSLTACTNVTGSKTWWWTVSVLCPSPFKTAQDCLDTAV